MFVGTSAKYLLSLRTALELLKEMELSTCAGVTYPSNYVPTLTMPTRGYLI